MNLALNSNKALVITALSAIVLIASFYIYSTNVELEQKEAVELDVYATDVIIDTTAISTQYLAKGAGAKFSSGLRQAVLRTPQETGNEVSQEQAAAAAQMCQSRWIENKCYKFAARNLKPATQEQCNRLDLNRREQCRELAINSKALSIRCTRGDEVRENPERECGERPAAEQPRQQAQQQPQPQQPAQEQREQPLMEQLRREQSSPSVEVEEFTIDGNIVKIVFNSNNVNAMAFAELNEINLVGGQERKTRIASEEKHNLKRFAVRLNGVEQNKRYEVMLNVCKEGNNQACAYFKRSFDTLPEQQQAQQALPGAPQLVGSFNFEYIDGDSFAVSWNTNINARYKVAIGSLGLNLFTRSGEGNSWTKLNDFTRTKDSFTIQHREEFNEVPTDKQFKIGVRLCSREADCADVESQPYGPLGIQARQVMPAVEAIEQARQQAATPRQNVFEVTKAAPTKNQAVLGEIPIGQAAKARVLNQCPSSTWEGEQCIQYVQLQEASPLARQECERNLSDPKCARLQAEGCTRQVVQSKRAAQICGQRWQVEEEPMPQQEERQVGFYTSACGTQGSGNTCKFGFPIPQNRQRIEMSNEVQAQIVNSVNYGTDNQRSMCPGLIVEILGGRRSYNSYYNVPPAARQLNPNIPSSVDCQLERQRTNNSDCAFAPAKAEMCTAAPQGGAFGRSVLRDEIIVNAVRQSEEGQQPAGQYVNSCPVITINKNCYQGISVPLGGTVLSKVELDKIKAKLYYQSVFQRSQLKDTCTAQIAEIVKRGASNTLPQIASLQECSFKAGNSKGASQLNTDKTYCLYAPVQSSNCAAVQGAQPGQQQEGPLRIEEQIFAGHVLRLVIRNSGNENVIITNSRVNRQVTSTRGNKEIQPGNARNLVLFPPSLNCTPQQQYTRNLDLIYKVGNLQGQEQSQTIELQGTCQSEVQNEHIGNLQYIDLSHAWLDDGLNVSITNNWGAAITVKNGSLQDEPFEIEDFTLVPGEQRSIKVDKLCTPIGKWYLEDFDLNIAIDYSNEEPPEIRQDREFVEIYGTCQTSTVQRLEIAELEDFRAEIKEIRITPSSVAIDWNSTHSSNYSVTLFQVWPAIADPQPQDVLTQENADFTLEDKTALFTSLREKRIYNLNLDSCNATGTCRRISMEVFTTQKDLQFSPSACEARLVNNNCRVGIGINANGMPYSQGSLYRVIDFARNVNNRSKNEGCNDILGRLAFYGFDFWNALSQRDNNAVLFTLSNEVYSLSEELKQTCPELTLYRREANEGQYCLEFYAKDEICTPQGADRYGVTLGNQEAAPAGGNNGGSESTPAAPSGRGRALNLRYGCEMTNTCEEERASESIDSFVQPTQQPPVRTAVSQPVPAKTEKKPAVKKETASKEVFVDSQAVLISAVLVLALILACLYYVIGKQKNN